MGQPIDVHDSHPDLTGDTIWLPLLDPETFENVHRIPKGGGDFSSRTEFYIHPGMVSQGCMTFLSETQRDRTSKVGYPFSSDYARLRSMIVNTDPAYVVMPPSLIDYVFPFFGPKEVRARVTVR